jgi:hypothetical protein
MRQPWRAVLPVSDAAFSTAQTIHRVKINNPARALGNSGRNPRR